MSLLWRKLLLSRSSFLCRQVKVSRKSFSTKFNQSLVSESTISARHSRLALFPNSSYSFSCWNNRSFSTNMPPVPPEEVEEKLEQLVKAHQVVIFSKTTCPFCNKVKMLFKELDIPHQIVELDKMSADEGAAWKQALIDKTKRSTVPNVFVNGKSIGGCDDTFLIHNQTGLLPLINGQSIYQEPASDDGDNTYDFDLVVIGGGSGGLAASKEAAKYGKKVAVLDFVKPTPAGTTWGIGGTCVNVGCIPKKLMHQAALLGTALKDAPAFGWNNAAQTTHDWPRMVDAIQDYIKSLNWGYRVALKDANVTYLNAFAEFVGPYKIKATDKKGKSHEIKAKGYVIAVGGRPRYPDIPGAREFGITSDDIFSLKKHPGTTVIIGASYIALECAGFLAGLGINVTVVARSILLRGFDRQIAGLIGEHMKAHGVRILTGWLPQRVELFEKADESTGTRNVYRMIAREGETGGQLEMKCHTLVFAIGRDACTEKLHLEKTGVILSEKTGKVLTNDADQSNVNHIYAIGDVAEGRPELTPSAIQAGKLLARRLYGGSSVLTDYEHVPTTVFTPLEYGCVGLSEEDAIAKYGEEDVEIYHTHFQALETVLPKRDENKCYAKLVCLKSKKERVVGFHYLGPNAGEVTQGFALGIRLGATKSDISSVIGIHPTTAETFTTMEITKSSGLNALKTGC